MDKIDNLDDCIALATFGHRKQKDKAGLPYIDHCLRVMRTVQEQGAAPHVQMAAVLHDLTEDQMFTAQMLLDLGVPEAAVEIVKLVDRDYSAMEYALLTNARMAITKQEQDKFYYENIRKNPGALQVKLADIGDNLQPWRLAYLPDETQDRLRKKYAKAIDLLT